VHVFRAPAPAHHRLPQGVPYGTRYRRGVATASHSLSFQSSSLGSRLLILWSRSVRKYSSRKTRSGWWRSVLSSRHRVLRCGKKSSWYTNQICNTRHVDRCSNERKTRRCGGDMLPVLWLPGPASADCDMFGRPHVHDSAGRLGVLAIDGQCTQRSRSPTTCPDSPVLNCAGSALGP